MDSDFGKSTDRISKLPDSILCHILSLLPTKYAVGSSILSTRWQFLWASVPSLKFDDSLISVARYGMSTEREAELDFDFMIFVNRVLLLTDVSRLEKFSLELENFCNFDIVDTWISAAIKRNLQELDLRFHVMTDYFLENPVPLPRVIFTSKTLVHLTLDGDILLNIPASVWLPNLKILNLINITYEDEDSAHKLFAGCPVLKELEIYRLVVDVQPVLNIYVPTLKRLSVTRLREYFYHPLSASENVDETNNQRHSIAIDAPKLECLDLTDYWAEDFSLENLSSLFKACLVIGPTRTRPDRSTNYNSRISKLLSGIANVKFLDFITGDTNYGVPTFHNLTRLRLGSDNIFSWSLDMVKKFLEYSPNLEVLILEGDRVIGSAILWSPPLRVPSCLLLHLKEFEIKTFDGEEYEFGLIEYMLKNSEVLKKMTIDCRFSDSCFCPELEGFPMASKTCQLNILRVCKWLFLLFAFENAKSILSTAS